MRFVFSNTIFLKAVMHLNKSLIIGNYTLLYKLHCSLAVKLIGLRARQIERVGRVGCVLARSRAIVRVSLKCLSMVLLGAIQLSYIIVH